ncbi:MAG: hypothetical protein ACK5KN_04185 [Dysgonomonas sp.]|uniref:hypothetical protein n=1 Tax=Dysgonomonas sp. TaxID=1891233 RepID=UPI003A897B18
MAKKARQRATSINNFVNINITELDFTGEWELAFGKPQKGGIWYVSGTPGSGKTSFIVQLIKVFAELGMRVRFYNFEEQVSKPLQEAIIRERVTDVAENVVMINEVIPYSEIKKELETTRTHVAIIDSRKKARLTSKQVEELRERFPNITIVIICHVKPNGTPEQTADSTVFQEATLKIKVDRYRALSMGRYFGERGYYNVWKEKADQCWAENI